MTLSSLPSIGPSHGPSFSVLTPTKNRELTPYPCLEPSSHKRSPQPHGHPSSSLDKKISAALQTQLLKYIPRTIKTELSEYIHNNPNLSEQEIQALKMRDWSHLNSAFSSDLERIKKALTAYVQNQIDGTTLSHHVLYDSCKDLPHFKVYSGKEAISKLLPEMTHNFFDQIHTQNNGSPLSALEFIFSKLSLESLSIFSFDLNYSRNGGPGLIQSVIQSFEISFPHPLFFLKKKGKANTYTAFIIPPDMLQGLMDCKFGSQAIQCDPSIGYGSKPKLSDWTKRVLGMFHPFLAPGSKFPIHTFEVKDTFPSLYYHDCWHQLSESSNCHRPLFAKIALQLPQYENRRNEFLDRPFYSYLSLYTHQLSSPFYPNYLPKNAYECFHLIVLKSEQQRSTGIAQILWENIDIWGKECGMNSQDIHAFKNSVDSLRENLKHSEWNIFSDRHWNDYTYYLKKSLAENTPTP